MISLSDKSTAVLIIRYGVLTIRYGVLIIRYGVLIIRYGGNRTQKIVYTNQFNFFVSFFFTFVVKMLVGYKFQQSLK